MIGALDRVLRSASYDILSRRDRSGGWKSHRASFLRDAARSPEELSKHANEGVERIVRHAYSTTSYYRSTWDAAGIRVGDGFRIADLESLPFLTKDIIRESKQSLVSTAVDREQLEESLTGGTTGVQTSFILDHDCAVARLGRQWGVFELCGYRPGMRRGLVWGVHLDLLDGERGFNPKRWFREYASSQEVLPCTVLNDELLEEYSERLDRFRPQVLYGYPSALAQVAKSVRNRKRALRGVRTIMTTAERLSSSHRRLLREVFGAEVFNLYCTREYGCIGFECREHNGLHVDTGSLFVEIIRDGRRVPAGQHGEIIITDLRNRGMPFIRSRTGDTGALAEGPCSCGLPFPLLKDLGGRSADVLYRPDGSVVAGLMLADLFADLPAVRASQFIQDEVAALDVLVVATDEYSQDVKQKIEGQVREIMGEQIIVNVRRVEDIPRSPRSGKIQEIVSRVKPARDAAAARGG